MLSILKEKNPTLRLYSIHDSEFNAYGKVISNINVEEFINVATTFEMPPEGSKYERSLAVLEQCENSVTVQNECFGETELQIGLCWGYNDRLNGLEYHKSSEFNIAATPMVLLLGTIFELTENGYHSENLQAFFLQKGETVELYATTLHFCPCQVVKSGFCSVVLLPKGTNAPLEHKPEDALLFRQNKWLICHDKNESLIEKGVRPLLHGENIKITEVSFER